MKTFGFDFAVDIAQKTMQAFKDLRKDTASFADELKGADKAGADLGNSLDEIIKKWKLVEYWKKQGMSGASAENMARIDAKRIKAQGLTSPPTDEELRSASAYKKGPTVADKFTAQFNKMRGNEKDGLNNINDINDLIERIQAARENGTKGLEDLQTVVEEYHKTIVGNTGGLQENAKAEEELTKISVKKTSSTKDLIKSLAVLTVAYQGVKIIMGATKDAARSLFNEIQDQSRMAQTMQTFFGNKQNAIAAQAFARRQTLAGKGAFGSDDVMQGFKELQSVGVDAQKQYDLVANMAGKTGRTFSETSDAISAAIKGNFSAFEEFGIQEIYLRHLNALKSNTPELRGAVLGYLQSQTMFQGGMEDSANSIDGSIRRIDTLMEVFKKSIVGDVSDPTSLASIVKKTISDVADFFVKHEQTVTDIGKSIGQVLQWIWKQVDTVSRKIMSAFDASLNSADGFLHNLKERTMSFVLWLEISKNKVVAFWREYREEIMLAGKILGGLWLFKKGAGVASSLLSDLKTVVDLFKDMRTAILAVEGSALLGILGAAGVGAAGVIATMEDAKKYGGKGGGGVDAAAWLKSMAARMGIDTRDEAQKEADKKLVQPAISQLPSTPADQAAVLKALEKMYASPKNINVTVKVDSSSGDPSVMAKQVADEIARRERMERNLGGTSTP